MSDTDNTDINVDQTARFEEINRAKEQGDPVALNDLLYSTDSLSLLCKSKNVISQLCDPQYYNKPAPPDDCN